MKHTPSLGLECLTDKGQSVLRRVIAAGVAGLTVGVHSTTYPMCEALAAVVANGKRIPLVSLDFHPSSGYRRVHYLPGSLTELYIAALPPIGAE